MDTSENPTTKTKTKVVNQQSKSVDVHIGTVKSVTNDTSSHMNNTEPTELGWLGNPYEVGNDHSLGEALTQFRADFKEKLANDEAFKQAIINLSGKTIGMYAPPHRTHGPIIAKYADKLAEEESQCNSLTVYGYGPNEGDDKQVTTNGEVKSI